MRHSSSQSESQQNNSISIDDILVERSNIPLKSRSQSQDTGCNNNINAYRPNHGAVINIEISQYYFEMMDREFKCTICKNLLSDCPKWLPCQHVFCHKCLQQQYTREKTAEKPARCAECRMDFSHRSLRDNKKFNRMLEAWRHMRTQNNLNTQLPTSFKPFDP